MSGGAVNLPPELQKFFQVTLGMPWPESNDEGLYAISDAWKRFGTALDEFEQAVAAGGAGVAEALASEVGEFFSSWLKGDAASGADQLRTSAAELERMAKNSAANVVKSKVMMVAIALMALASVIELLVSVFGALFVSVVLAGARAALAALWRALVTRLGSLTMRGAGIGLAEVGKQAAKFAAIGGGLFGGLDLTIQGVQQAAGLRADLDGHSLLGSFVGGAMGGAFAGIVHAGAIWLRGTAQTVPKGLPGVLRASGHFSYGSAQVLAALATAPLINLATGAPGTSPWLGVLGALSGFGGGRRGGNAASLDDSAPGFELSKAPEFRIPNADEKPADVGTETSVGTDIAKFLAAQSKEKLSAIVDEKEATPPPYSMFAPPAYSPATIADGGPVAAAGEGSRGLGMLFTGEPTVAAVPISAAAPSIQDGSVRVAAAPAAETVRPGTETRPGGEASARSTAIAGGGTRPPVTSSAGQSTAAPSTGGERSMAAAGRAPGGEVPTVSALSDRTTPASSEAARPAAGDRTAGAVESRPTPPATAEARIEATTPEPPSDSHPGKAAESGKAVVTVPLAGDGNLMGAVAFVPREAAGPVAAAVARMDVEPGTFVVVGRHSDGRLEVPEEAGPGAVAELPATLVPWSRMSRLLLVACDLTHPVVESVQRQVDARPDARDVRVVPYALDVRLHVRANGTIVPGERPADAVVSLDPDTSTEPAVVRAETDRVLVRVATGADVSAVARQLRVEGVDQRPVLRLEGPDFRSLPGFAQELSAELGRPVDRRPTAGRSWVRHFPDGREPVVHSRPWSAEAEATARRNAEAAEAAEADFERASVEADQLEAEARLLIQETLDVIQRMPMANAVLQTVAPDGYLWDADRDLIGPDGDTFELDKFADVAEHRVDVWRQAPVDPGRNADFLTRLRQWGRAIDELREERRDWERQEIRRYAGEIGPLPIGSTGDHHAWSGHGYVGFAVSARARIPGDDRTIALPQGWRSSPDRSAFRSPPAWFQQHGWGAFAATIAGSPGVDALHVDLGPAGPGTAEYLVDAAYRLARLGKIFERPIFDLAVAAAGRTPPMLRTEAVPNPYPSAPGVTESGGYNGGPHDHIEFGNFFSLHEHSVSFRLPYLVRDPGALVALSDLYLGLLDRALNPSVVLERRVLGEDSAYQVAADPARASSGAQFHDLLEILQADPAAEARLLRLFANVPEGHTARWEGADPSIGRGSVRVFPGLGADFGGVLRSLETVRVPPGVQLVVAERASGGLLRPDGGRLPFEEFRRILAGREPADRLGQTPEALAAGIARGRLALAVSRFPAGQAQSLADVLGTPLLATGGQVVRDSDGRIRSDLHWTQFWPNDPTAVWTARATDLGDAVALARGRFPSDVPALLEDFHANLASADRHLAALAGEDLDALLTRQGALRDRADAVSAVAAGEVPARFALDSVAAAADLRTQLRTLRDAALSELFEYERGHGVPAGGTRLVPHFRASTVEPPVGNVQLRLAFHGHDDAVGQAGRGDVLDVVGGAWTHEPGPEGTRFLRSPLQPTEEVFTQLDQLARSADDGAWPAGGLGAQIRVDAGRLLTRTERGRLLRLVKAFEATLYRFGGAELALHEVRPVVLPERGLDPGPAALADDGTGAVGFEIDHAAGTELVRLGFWRSSFDPAVLVSQTALSRALIQAAKDPLIDRVLDGLIREPRLVNDPDGSGSPVDGLADLFDLIEVSQKIETLIVVTYAHSADWAGGDRTDPHGLSRLVRRENVAIFPGVGESVGQVLERVYSLDAQPGAHLVIGTPGSARGSLSAWNGDELTAEHLADALSWSVPASAGDRVPPLGLVVPGGARGVAGPLAELLGTPVLATRGDVRVENGAAVTDRGWLEFGPDGRSRETGETVLTAALLAGSQGTPLHAVSLPFREATVSRGDVVVTPLPARGALVGGAAFVPREAAGAVAAAVGRMDVEPGTFVLVGRHRAGALEVPSGRSEVAAALDALPVSMVPWSRMSRLLLVACDLTHPVVESVQRYVDARPDAAGVRVVPYALEVRLHVRADGTIVAGERPPDAVVSLDPDAVAEPAVVRAETDRVQVYLRADSEVAAVAAQLRASGFDRRPVLRVSGLGADGLPRFAQALSVELGRPVDIRTWSGRSWVRHFPDEPPYLLSWLPRTGYVQEAETLVPVAVAAGRAAQDADEVVRQARAIAEEAEDLVLLLPPDRGLLRRVTPPGYTWDSEGHLVDRDGDVHGVVAEIGGWLESWQTASADGDRTAVLRSDLRQWGRVVDELRSGWRSWAHEEITRYAETSSRRWPPPDELLAEVAAGYSGFAVSGRTLHPDIPAVLVSDWATGEGGSAFRSPSGWFGDHDWTAFADMMSGPLAVDAIHLGNEVVVEPSMRPEFDRAVFDLAWLGKIFEGVIFELVAAAAGPGVAANRSAVLPNPYPTTVGTAEVGGYNASPRDLIAFEGLSFAGAPSVTFRLPYPVRDPAAVAALTNLFASLYDAAWDARPAAERLLRDERGAYVAGAAPATVSRTARFLDLLEILRLSPEDQEPLFRLFAKVEDGQDLVRNASDGSVGRGNVRVFPGPGSELGRTLELLEALSTPRDTHLVLAERAPKDDSLLLADGRLPFEEFVARLAERDLAGLLGQTAGTLADGIVRGRLGVAVSWLRPEQAQSLADGVGVPVLATAGEVVHRSAAGITSSRSWVQFWPGDAEAAWDTRERAFDDALAAARGRFPSDKKALLRSYFEELHVVEHHLDVLGTEHHGDAANAFHLLVVDLRSLDGAPAGAFASSFALGRIATTADLRARLRVSRLAETVEALAELRLLRTPDDGSGRLIDGLDVTTLEPPDGRVEVALALPADRNGAATDGRERQAVDAGGTRFVRLPMQQTSSVFAQLDSLGREAGAGNRALGTVIRVDPGEFLTSAERRRLLRLVKGFEAQLFRFGGSRRSPVETRPVVFPERGTTQDTAALPDDGVNAVGFEVDPGTGTERIRLGFWPGSSDPAVLAAQTALSVALVEAAKDGLLDGPLDHRMREPRLVDDPVDPDLGEAALISELMDLLELLSVSRDLSHLAAFVYAESASRSEGPSPALAQGRSSLLRREAVTLVPEARALAVERLYSLDAQPGAHLLLGTLNGDGPALRTWNGTELPIDALARALAESVPGLLRGATATKLALVVPRGALVLGGPLATHLGMTVLATRGEVRVEDGVAVADRGWIEFGPDGRARDTSEVDLTEALRGRAIESSRAARSFPVPLPDGAAFVRRRPDGRLEWSVDRREAVVMPDGLPGTAAPWARMSGRAPTTRLVTGGETSQPTLAALMGLEPPRDGAGPAQSAGTPARLPAIAAITADQVIRQLSTVGLDRGDGELTGVSAGAFNDGAEARAWASAVEHEDLRRIWTPGSTVPQPVPWQHLTWNPVHLLVFGDGSGFLNTRGNRSGWLDGAQFGAGLAADAEFRRAAGEYAAAPLVVTGLSGAPARIAEQVLALQAALRRAGMMRDIYLAPSHTALRPDGGFEVPPGRTFTLFSAPPPRPEEVRVDYHTARNGELVMASLPSTNHLDQATWASLLTEDTERTYYEWSTRYQEDVGYDTYGIGADGSRLVVEREIPWARLGVRPFYLAGGGNATGFQAALSPPGGDTFAADPRFLHDLIVSRGLLADVPPRRRNGLALLFCDVGSGAEESVAVRLLDLLRPNLGADWTGFAATNAIVLPVHEYRENPLVLESGGQFVVYSAATRQVRTYRGAEVG
ncbi:hypothetical protein GCM10027598_60530 [Amycolatopsis oliviviridis]|uniref:Outer membrane channel protein CpnT-like N-terminal domain-containing protein n=1 Tax=Amycolatopsis oliviviridis TaxID=1471590 RepID=A0ABQ3ME44_9PSEU|nr:hypothetical protein [Amycolatopsis oliviviridis]GHH38234.1 hypothetical protein GCM10017790_83700 [Amycolatopsis oliviviridis]